MLENYIANGQIKSYKILLINKDGINLGIKTKIEALNIADQDGLDLVQVGQQEVPVCKICDLGKLKFENEKKQKKSKSHKDTMKEMQIGFNISDHDFETKKKHIVEFLSKGFRVNYVFKLNNSKRVGQEDIMLKYNRLLDSFTEVANNDGAKVSQKSISTILTPKV